jgi:hypothetical protein
MSTHAAHNLVGIALMLNILLFLDGLVLDDPVLEFL